MANTIYKRMDSDAMIYFVNYLLNKLKTSPLSDNTTYTIEKSVNGQSFVLKDDAGNTISTIGGLITDAERTKLGQDLATESYVNQQIAATGHIQLRKVQSLPPVAEASTNIIYLVPISGDDEGNNYMEYYLQDGAWENLGSTKVDLSGYVQSSEMTTLSNAEITTIVNDAFDTVFPKPSYSYAVLNNYGQDLTVFRSYDIYEDKSTGTFTDTKGQEYTGKIFDGLETKPRSMNDNELWTSWEDRHSIKNFHIVDGYTVSPASTCSWFADSQITSIDFTGLDTSKLTDVSSMFNGCYSLTSIDVSNFDTSKVTNMDSMFAGCSALTSIDTSNFDTSNVTNMSDMFNSCSSLTSITLPDNFVTSNVTDVGRLFDGCYSLTSIDVSNFNTSNVTNMDSMFASCSSLTSIDLSNFNTSNVTNMDSMFVGCSSLTSIDLSNFNTSNVTNMSYMFGDCKNLSRIYSNSFDTSAVTDSDYMFNFCTSLVGGNGTTFDSNHVDKTYAHIDEPGTPGYFTDPAALDSGNPDSGNPDSGDPAASDVEHEIDNLPPAVTP